jgi:uncharacterized glyoxalase superfamily protein PhnB
MADAKLLSVAPVLLVENIHKSAEFWRDKLGFEPTLYGDPKNFAIVERDGVRVMLAQAPPKATIVPNWRVVPCTNQAYIWVTDVDAMYAEVKSRGAEIDFTIYNTPWGTREFGVQDPAGHDIAFGQVL